MPIYEYECLKCGHKFSRLGKMDENPPSCPRVVGSGEKETPCGGQTKRLVSRSHFQLKGGGWAKDGY